MRMLDDVGYGTTYKINVALAGMRPGKPLSREFVSH